NSLSVTFGGVTLTSFTTTQTGAGTYQFKSFANVAATGSSTVLAFSSQYLFQGPGGVGAVIDDVNVGADSLVPEPGSLATLASGLIGLGLMAVRRLGARRQLCRRAGKG